MFCRWWILSWYIDFIWYKAVLGIIVIDMTLEEIYWCYELILTWVLGYEILENFVAVIFCLGKFVRGKWNGMSFVKCVWPYQFWGYCMVEGIDESMWLIFLKSYCVWQMFWSYWEWCVSLGEGLLLLSWPSNLDFGLINVFCCHESWKFCLCCTGFKMWMIDSW